MPGRQLRLPAPEGWGNVPVWGFAEVIDSRHEGFKRGERIYGLLPMATHLVLRPDRVNEFRFVDATAHRQKLPSAYNLYLRADRDPTYQPRDEGLQALLRPVFITSFLIDDFLADEGFFGADCVLLSSASSKTAFGLAHQLHRRAGIEVIGLTSTAHGGFVRGLGCYNQVLAYDEMARLPAQRPTVYVDFAGSSALRSAVHEHYGSSLKYSSAIGFSHRETGAPQAGLPGPEPVFFFAPDRLRKRATDWGRDGIDTRFADQWREFLPVARHWLTVVAGHGPEAVEAVYGQALRGTVPPDRGHILSMVGPDPVS